MADVESEVLAADETGPGDDTRRPRFRRRLPGGHVTGVALLSGVVALLNGALGLQLYYRVQLGGYDLVIFDQAIRAYSHFHMPVSTFKNLTDTAEIAPGYHQQFSILGDHFSPILAVLAPLYWIWNSPEVLLVAQALLFGAAVPFVWVFTRRALTPLGVKPWVAYAVGFAFGVCWMIQQATAAGFHEVAFIVPIMAAMIERGQAAHLGRGRGRWWHVTVAAILLGLCKEDMGLVVAAYGAVLFLAYRKRRMGLAFIVLGLAATVFAVEVWLPAFGQAKGFYWYYTPLGNNIWDALRTLILHPHNSLRIALTPRMKQQVMLSLFWPLLFLPLFSPLLLLAVPLLAERMWSYKPEHWHFTQHYNSMLAPVVFLGAVDGVARLFPLVSRLWARWRGTPRLSVARPVRLWAGSIAVLAAVLVPFWPSMGDMPGAPFEQLFKPSQWYRAAGEQSGVDAISVIPKGSVVAADDNISTYMSADYDVRLLTPTGPQAPWIITENYRILYPFVTVDQLYGYILKQMSSGYHVVYAQGGYIVLHKGT